eukprot:365067-Chlamydomonas_euryale.AAC.27
MVASSSMRAMRRSSRHAEDPAGGSCSLRMMSNGGSATPEADGLSSRSASLVVRALWTCIALLLRTVGALNERCAHDELIGWPGRRSRTPRRPPPPPRPAAAVRELLWWRLIAAVAVAGARRDARNADKRASADRKVKENCDNDTRPTLPVCRRCPKGRLPLAQCAQRLLQERPHHFRRGEGHSGEGPEQAGSPMQCIDTSVGHDCMLALTPIPAPRRPAQTWYSASVSSATTLSRDADLLSTTSTRSLDGNTGMAGGAAAVASRSDNRAPAQARQEAPRQAEALRPKKSGFTDAAQYRR